MSKRVTFNGSSGSSFAKKRKRMPGTNKSRKPEMKYFDAFNALSGAGQLQPMEFVNMGFLAAGEWGAGRVPSWHPKLLVTPIQGTNYNQVVGKQYILKYLKLKGFISVNMNVNANCNWRLCLIRFHDQDPSSLDYDKYLGMFNNVTLNATHPPTDVAGVQLEVVNNYHTKISNPDVSNVFKRKVIASGVIPKTANFVFTKQARYIADQATANYAAKRFNSFESNGGNAMYLPIDVSVTLNDNVDPTSVRYYVVLETDQACGCAWSDWTDEQNLDSDENLLSMDKDDVQFYLKIYCKAYFEDY